MRPSGKKNNAGVVCSYYHWMLAIMKCSQMLIPLGEANDEAATLGEDCRASLTDVILISNHSNPP